MGEYSGSTEQTAVGVRVAIVASRYNEEIVSKLVESAADVYKARGGVADYLTTTWVPGAFEIPLMAKRLAEAHNVDAVVACGAVVRGDTPHFDFIAAECTRGLMTVLLETKVPMIYGVLTTETQEQARDRTKGGSAGDKGAEAMEAALEMVSLLRALPFGGSDGDNTAWIRAGK
jgi:6,7-dimethyl-8-ribityllumazine synthase